MKKYWISVLLLALTVRVLLAFYWEKRLEAARFASDRPTAIQQKDPTGSSTVPETGGKTESNHVPRPAGQDGPFFFGDSDSYWKLGRALAFGRPYEFDEIRHWTIFRMPGYPALLTPFFKIEGEHPSTLPVRLLGALIGMLTVGLTGLVAFELFQNQKIALLASLFAALEPCAAVQSILILAEEPFTAALLVQIWLMTIFFKQCGEDHFFKKGIGLALLIGLFSAWTVFFRPSWYYFPPFAFAFLILSLILKRKDVLKKTTQTVALLLIVLMTFAVFLAPWVYRNYRLTNRIIPTTLQMGASLYDGLSPDADGSSDMRFIDAFRSIEAQENGPIGPTPRDRAQFEIRLDQRMRNASLDWTKKNPGEAIKLSGVKFLRLWNLVPNERSFSSPIIRGVIFLADAPVILLGLLGCVLLVRRNAACWLLWLPALYLTGLHVIFVSSIRYRTPAMFGLMIAAAFVIVQFFAKDHNILPPSNILSQSRERDK